MRRRRRSRSRSRVQWRGRVAQSCSQIAKDGNPTCPHHVSSLSPFLHPKAVRNKDKSTGHLLARRHNSITQEPVKAPCPPLLQSLRARAAERDTPPGAHTPVLRAEASRQVEEDHPLPRTPLCVSLMGGRRISATPICQY